MTEKVDEPLREEIQKFCDPGFPIYRVKKVELVTADKGDGDDRGARRGKWIISNDVCFVYRDCDHKWRIIFIIIIISWSSSSSIVCLTTFSDYELQNVNFSTSMLKCFRWWRHLKGYHRNTVDSRYCGHPRGEGGRVGGDLVSVIVRVHKARADWNQEVTIVYDKRRWKKFNYQWNLCCQERWTAISEKKKRTL